MQYSYGILNGWPGIYWLEKTTNEQKEEGNLDKIYSKQTAGIDRTLIWWEDLYDNLGKVDRKCEKKVIWLLKYSDGHTDRVYANKYEIINGCDSFSNIRSKYYKIKIEILEIKKE